MTRILSASTLMTVLLLGVLAPPLQALTSPPYSLQYKVALDPAREGARVTITADHGEYLKHISFDNAEGLISDIEATGKLSTKGSRVTWDMPAGKVTLSYFVKITHERDPGEYDAMITKDWALFRGDDVVPAMYVYSKGVDDAYAKDATLEFVLPPGWRSVETGWPRLDGNTFLIDNPERRFDRPTGWMIAGDLGTRHTTYKGTAITISAPKGQNYQRMDAMIYLRFVWRELKEAFVDTPKKLLVVGAGDPMWRGGLSASNSLFLHADRPLVSENGTSSLLHELTHMVTRISGVKTDDANDDWIAEGLAEFYSFELLYRSRGISGPRRAKIIANLQKWGAEVQHLRKGDSTGKVTARAVVLLDELDKEIRQLSGDKHSIDDVTRQLMVIRKVTLADLRNATESLVGEGVKTLESPLLK